MNEQELTMSQFANKEDYYQALFGAEYIKTFGIKDIPADYYLMMYQLWKRAKLQSEHRTELLKLNKALIEDLKIRAACKPKDERGTVDISDWIWNDLNALVAKIEQELK